MTTPALVQVSPSNVTDLSAPAIDYGANPNNPAIPSAAYGRMQPRWEKCRACFIGTEAIRDGGAAYLPQFAGESDDDYAIRRDLAAFYNGFARTVLASVGLLLHTEPSFGKDMPKPLVALWENIDAAGTHGAVFTRKLATAGIIDGYGGILVEHPQNPDAGKISGDEEQQRGMRPYFLLFRASDVYKALYAPVNGVRRLVLLILREVTSVRVGEFGIKTIIQYRIWTNTNGVIQAQVWRSQDGLGLTPQLAEGPFTISNQTSIPWSPLVAGDEVAVGEIKPPLLDLAELNIQYHNSLTNHLSLQQLAYVPTPVRVGAVQNEQGAYPEIVLGPRQTIEAPVMPGVAQPIYWLSPPVDVLSAGEKTLSSTKADMATLGAAFLSNETRAAETAEAKRIDSAASRATLSSIRRSLQDCLELAFQFAGNYLGEKGGSVTLNADFTGEEIDPRTLAAVLQAYTEGIITLEEARYFIQTGQLPEDFDASDAKILEELAGQAAARELAAQAAKDAKASNNGTAPPDPANTDPLNRPATGQP
jgi:hypothetical protein